MEKKTISQRENFIIHQILSIILVLAVKDVLSATHNSDKVSPPTIIPNETDITAKLNENVRLICMATEPIYWRFHKAIYDYDIHTYQRRDNEYPYESVLDLNRVDITYVDYYYCVKNVSEPNASIESLLESNEAAQIYVFVEDRRHPLVGASVPILQGNQYDEILIPCKPTSSNFEVQLFKEGFVRHQIHATFNPSEGFRLKLNTTDDAGQYACHAKFDVAEKFDIYFTVEVNAADSNILSEPTITTKTEDFGIENGQIELYCSVKVASMMDRLEMKWELPNDNIAMKERRVQIISPASSGFEYSPDTFELTGKLIVRNVDREKDIGLYQCLVNDAISTKLATLNVKKSFESQKPQLTLSDVFYNVGEHVNVTCDIVSYPPSKVVWSFTPCDEIDISILCDESKRITPNDKFVVTTQQTQSTQISTLDFKPTGRGVIICEASNTEGKSEARANVIANDLTEYFSIVSNNDVPVVVGDKVTVVCAASAFKYTDMNWFKGNVLVTNSSHLQVITKHSPHSQRKEIHWNSIDKDAAGQYDCRVKLMHSYFYLNKSWELHVIEPTLPTIVLSNIEYGQTQKYMLEDYANLMCKFSGIPRPIIKWFKDNVEIIPVENDAHLSLLQDNSILSIHLNAGDEGTYRCMAENQAGQAYREVTVNIENLSDLKEDKVIIYGFIPVIMFGVAFLVICIICLVIRYRH